MPDRLFNTFQIAALLRTSPCAVDQWIADGQLRSVYTIKGAAHVSESDLFEFIENQGLDIRDAPDQNPVTGQGDESCCVAPTEDPEPIVEEAVEPVEPGQPDESDELPAPSPAPEPSGPQAGQICDAILTDAIKHGAQAIHLTPQPEGLKLQLRINSDLNDKPHFGQRLPEELRREIIACMLNRADPDIVPGDINVPHSIEFFRPIEGVELKFRLSVLPTVNGPRLVISTPLGADVTLPEGPAGVRLDELLRGDGLILAASKRRFGRDHTLRALLGRSETLGRSVVAIEQRIEPYLEDVVQVQLDSLQGLTYAAVAAELEHQDADTILLTELRDPSTASAAFNAAHDGALVIAGINACSASGAMVELLEMGLEPWPLGTTLKAIVEQSMVRTVCEHCHGGCDRCAHTGWSGTTLLSGVVFIEGRLRELIRTGGSPEQLARAVAQTSESSLTDAAQAAVDAGVTTMEEVAHLLIGA
jgi:type II secretory ATPase GspE/PulE/Tfp pilus assembly ATPase PilB-like protein